ncbi:MAG: hypothetical protein AAFO82_05930 [Bacteroidota bacterium]
MNQQIEFQVKKSIVESKEETLKYFLDQGFKLVSSNKNSLQFRRGSMLRNMITFNPLKWKSSIQIEFHEENIVVNFDINTIYQIVTIREERLWANFISNYQRTIETGKSLIFENQIELKNTKKSSWKYIRYALLGAITFGVPSGIIAYLTDIESIVAIGTASGALTFMMNKINKEKEENLTQ